MRGREGGRQKGVRGRKKRREGVSERGRVKESEKTKEAGRKGGSEVGRE